MTAAKLLAQNLSLSANTLSATKQFSVGDAIIAWARHLRRNSSLITWNSATLVIAISCRGSSPNVLGAAQARSPERPVTIGFTGGNGGDLGAGVDLCVRIAGDNIGHHEDMHLVLNHAIATALRAHIELFAHAPADAIGSRLEDR